MKLYRATAWDITTPPGSRRSGGRHRHRVRHDELPHTCGMTSSGSIIEVYYDRRAGPHRGF
jgi:hypothetical protein